MAEPLYIWLGNTAKVGLGYGASGGGSGLRYWSADHVDGAAYYDWDKRATYATDPESGDPKYRFGPSVALDSYNPRTWNHDELSASNDVATITQGSTTTVTTTVAHGRTAGQVVEILIQGVTGADAATLNGTWDATATGTHGWIVPVDTTGLTLIETGRVSQPGWLPYTERVTTVGSYPIVSHTDRTDGGSIGYNSTDSRSWGAEMSMLCDLHERWGADAKRAYYLELPFDAPLSARPSVSVTAVSSSGSDTRLTVASTASMMQDAGKAQDVVLYGFTGDQSALNGSQSAYVVDSTTIEVRGVDSSAWGAYGGGGRGVIAQRWAERWGEFFGDFEGRLRDAVDSASDVLGVTLECKGVICGFGLQDFEKDRVRDTAVKVDGFAIGSATTSGFPTTITLDSAQPYSESDGQNLVQVRITGTGTGLDRVHEARIVDSTTLILHYANTESVTAGSGQVQIGGPTHFWREEIAEFVSDVRSAIETQTGDTAADIPVLFVEPMMGDRGRWDGVSAYASFAGKQRALDGFRASHAPRAGVVSLGTSGIELDGTDQGVPSIGGAVELGHLVATELLKLETPSTSYGEETTGGVPVYVIVGDSVAVGGSNSNYLAAYYDRDPNYDGSEYSGRGVKIWNATAGAFEDFTGVKRAAGLPIPGNSNTHPQLNINPSDLVGGPGTITGPDQSLLLEMKGRHSVPIYCVKLGVPGSVVTGATASYGIVSATATTDDDGAPVCDVVLNTTGHGRYDTTQVFTVTASGLSSIGVPDGTYTASSTSVTAIRLTLSSPGSGTTTSASAAIGVPHWDWREAQEDVWPYLKAQKDAAFAAIEAEGKYPDVRGIFAPGLGLQDAMVGTPANYESDMTALIASLRSLFTTRSSPSPSLPFVLGRVRTSSEYPGGTTTQTSVGTIQAAQDAIAAADSAVAVADPDSLDESDIEATTVPLGSTDIDLTWRGLIKLGSLLNNAFDDVDQSCASLSSSSGSSGAEFVS